MSNLITGTSFNDTLDGAENNLFGFDFDSDEIKGLSGDDELVGLEGNDTLRGGIGDDSLIGDDNSTDSFFSDDVLEGGVGNDDLVGNGGNDTLTGGIGNDNLSGNEGKDVITGGFGSDFIFGGEGDDRIIGTNPVGPNSTENEFDTLNGGDGSDTFVLGNVSEAFYQGAEVAEIRDFDFREGDTLQLHGSESDYSTIETNSFGSTDTTLLYQGDQIGVLQDVSGFEFQLSLDAEFV